MQSLLTKTKSENKMTYLLPIYDVAVLYKEQDSLPADPPLVFLCEADDSDHAEEQCQNAYPNCTVVWTVVDCISAEEAFADYHQHK